MANKYKGFFGIGVVPSDTKVITTKTMAPIVLQDDEGSMEEIELPIIMQIISRKGMHEFVDKFFDKLEEQ